MNMVIPDAGKLLLAEWLWQTEDVSFGSLFLVLYQNDYTPIDGSVYADFTAATFTGSDAITIDRADWGGPTLVSHVAYVDITPGPEWTCTGGGPQTCYGWFLRDSSTSTVVAAQRFDAPRVMDTGSTETLDPFAIGLQTLH